MYILCILWGVWNSIPYSGKLAREKTFANWWKYDFRGENFRGLLAFAMLKDATPQISWRKLSRIATKPRNSRKFSTIRYVTRVRKRTVGVAKVCAIVSLGTSQVDFEHLAVILDQEKTHGHKELYHRSTTHFLFFSLNSRNDVCVASWDFTISSTGV